MATKKDLIIAVTCTFCLTAAVLSLLPVGSQGEWNPWLDAREDGAINVLDLIKIAGALGTSGDTTRNVNVTNFPLDEQGNLRIKVIQNTNSSQYNVTLNPGEWWKITIKTEGYREITLAMNSYDPIGMWPKQSLTIVSWYVHDSYTGQEDSFTFSGHKFITYGVHGHSIILNVQNPSDVDTILFQVSYYITT
jgi:hypothetical protein